MLARLQRSRRRTIGRSQYSPFTLLPFVPDTLVNHDGHISFYELKVGDVVDVRVQVRSANIHIYSVPNSGSGRNYFGNGNSVDGNFGTARVALDDHLRGTRGIVDVTTSSVSASEINYRFTTKILKRSRNRWIFIIFIGYRHLGFTISIISLIVLRVCPSIANVSFSVLLYC